MISNVGPGYNGYDKRFETVRLTDQGLVRVTRDGVKRLDYRDGFQKTESLEDPMLHLLNAGNRRKAGSIGRGGLGIDGQFLGLLAKWAVRCGLIVVLGMAMVKGMEHVSRQTEILQKEIIGKVVPLDEHGNWENWQETLDKQIKDFFNENGVNRPEQAR